MALLTDLYELTMAHVYFDHGMNDIAVFELNVRKLPPNRSFLLAAGLEQAMGYLEQLRFTSDDLEFLRGLGTFPQAFLDHLATLRFTGSVHAMPEGTPLFANEPILRVTAPIAEAQLVESRLLNIVHFQTLIASKAVRSVVAARGKQLVDFGMRRAHEADAALFAARAAYIAGFDGTATVEAGRRFGIPLSGTMAHSFIEAHDHEEDAFRHFIASRPTAVTLLIDTYDTQRAARRVVALARELESRGAPRAIHGVRIDSGDLAMQTRAVRDLFDGAGYRDIQILLSGGLDEYSIEKLVRDGVPMDAFGVGTALDVSDDAPALDMAYKLQEYSGTPRRKRSPGKVTWPGAKQVFRERGQSGEIVCDRIALVGEQAPVGEQNRGEPLLTEVMRAGRRVGDVPELKQIREYCSRELQALPQALRDLGDTQGSGPIPVLISDALRKLVATMDAAGD
ncbi:MAG: nicotinate phosphoribosyltransferase [Steroidobacteraceae bacterium]